MKCTKCDKEIENGAKFCTFCGTVQEEIKEEKPTNDPVIEVVPKAAKKPEKKAKKEAKAPKNATLPEQKAKDKPKKEKAPKKDIPKETSQKPQQIILDFVEDEIVGAETDEYKETDINNIFD